VGQARNFRVNQVPNGSRFNCQTCHVSAAGGGTRNPFGNAVFNLVRGPANIAFWSPTLAALDSDGDGFTNGEELGDPEGDFTVIPGFTATNPGNANSRPVVNTPPSVQFTSPVSGGSVRQPQSVTLEATATDQGGTVVRVEFLLDGEVVATDTTFPFSHALDTSLLSLGAHQLAARATDNGGLSTSDAITLNVLGPFRLNAPTPTAGGGLELTWPSVPGATYVIEVSTTLEQWTELGTVTAEGEVSRFEDAAAGEIRFYLVRETL